MASILNPGFIDWKKGLLLWPVSAKIIHLHLNVEEKFTHPDRPNLPATPLLRAKINYPSGCNFPKEFQFCAYTIAINSGMRKPQPNYRDAIYGHVLHVLIC